MTTKRKRYSPTARRRVIRLRQRWLESRGLSVPQFATEVGLEYNTVQRWFGMGRKPRALYLEAVMKKYPGFPA